MSRRNAAVLTPSSPPASGRRPRGRPPRLSREAIVDKALELLAVHAADEVSMALVADGLGMPTMTLYNYFPNTESLLNAVADRAFALFRFPKAQLEKPPEEALLAWLWAVARHAERYPISLKTMSIEGQVSAPWIRAQAPAIATLRRMGFAGRSLTFAFSWLTSQAIGLIIAERYAQQAREHYATRGPIASLDATAQQDQDELKKHLGRIHSEDVVDFGLRHVVDGLRKLRPPAT